MTDRPSFSLSHARIGVRPRVIRSFFETKWGAIRDALESLWPPSNRDRDDEGIGDERDADGRLDPGEDLPEWETIREIDGELSIGDAIRFTKTISERDVVRFAAASGDSNPLHLDDAYAERTRFDGRIAHGVLVAGVISAAMARFPGCVVYLSQDLEFRAPVRIGDRVTATVEIVDDLGGDRYRIRTVTRSGDEKVIDGEAVVLVDDAPAET